MSVRPNTEQVKPMSNSELFQAAPSIFSENPIDGVSDRYAFVPTYSVLDTFREAGYYPIMASESKVRNSVNQGYQRHIIQFRSIDHILRPNSNEEYADIVLTNSHNRTSSFTVDLAIFRIVCENMMVVPSHTFSHHSIIHSGFNLDKVIKAIDEVTSYMPTIQHQIEQFKSIELNPLEQQSLAKAAIDIRFDKDAYIVNPQEFLKENRDADKNDNSLWITFQKVQEAMIRGGSQAFNKQSNKSFKSKAINSIDAMKFNKKLFSTVQTLASLKMPSLQIAA